MRPGGPVPIAPRTLASEGFGEARRRVLSLYREWLREAPRMIASYPLDLSVGTVRARIRREFERYRPIKDLPIIDRLILQGTQDLIETHSKWKQKTHILYYFDREEAQLEKDNERRRLLLPNNKTPSAFLYGFLKRGGV
jgi:NADH dehydrogenase (ubiquinone) 1 alpha subcomplex subunit 6